jgi:hypothetical protein
LGGQLDCLLVDSHEVNIIGEQDNLKYTPGDNWAVNNNNWGK